MMQSLLMMEVLSDRRNHAKLGRILHRTKAGLVPVIRTVDRAIASSMTCMSWVCCRG